MTVTEVAQEPQTANVLRGLIHEAPPQKKNQPGRGPPKKELMHRRYAQFGELLRSLGILEDEDGNKIPVPLPSAAPQIPGASVSAIEVTETTEKVLDSHLNFKSLVPIIRHSEPANELEWFDPQLRERDPVRSFRRPVTHHREGQRVKLVVDSNQFDQSGGSGASAGVRVDSAGVTPVAGALGDRIWRKSDVSARTGKICLFEYAEQHPLLLNGVGMSSNLLNLYRQEKGSTETPPRPEMGFFIPLAPDEVSPLLTKIESGKVYRILQNNMMNVPVFEHRTANSDFLIVRKKSSSLSQSSALDASKLPHEICLVRKIHRFFAAGQVEPQIELFQPNEATNAKTKFMTWLEKYMEFHFATRLKRRDDLRIQFQFALDLFALANENMVTRALSEVAEKEKAGGENKKRWWVPKGAATGSTTTEVLSPHEIRRELEDKRRACLQYLKPEECCSWEQLQVGLSKLNQAGIEKVSRAEVPRLIEAFQMIRKLHNARKFSHEALMELNKTNKTPFPSEARKQYAAARSFETLQSNEELRPEILFLFQLD